MTRPHALDIDPHPFRFDRAGLRGLDRAASDELGIPTLLLMEHAARGLAAEVLRSLRAPSPPRVIVACGPGNNGGDGYAAARLLHAAGLEVALHVARPPRTGGDASLNAACCARMGLPQIDLAAVAAAGPETLLIDALLGTGAVEAPSGTIAAAIDAIAVAAARGAAVFAADIPSGLDADTGRVTGCAVRAATTVTFAGLKSGFDLPGAAEWTGRIVVAPLGVPRSLLARFALPARP